MRNRDKYLLGSRQIDMGISGEYMAYVEQNSVEKGLRFKTRGGLVVKTTGSTTHIESKDIYVHEVEVVEGPSQGSKYLHNLDYAEPVPS